MDIEYLYVLQELREAAGPVAEQFFLLVSSVLVGAAMVAIPMIIYWCRDKKLGLFVMLSFSLGVAVNNLIKCIACVPRPWIRDSRITPSEAALKEATGYSFPSGHTQSAMSIYGAAGWKLRKNSRLAPFFGGLIVALVGFSRNFLGVHTPQDVLVAIFEAAFIIWVADKLLTLLEELNDTGALVFLGLATLLSITYLLFCTLKPYPTAAAFDTSAQSMLLDAYESAGLFLGTAIGWWLERRFVHYIVDAPRTQKFLRVCVGLFLVLVARYLIATPLGDMLGETWKDFLKALIPVVVGLAGAPALFMKLPFLRGK